ncbi:MAG: GGDEF domain-containing phosphodiesterase [bacterium]|nr:GGDEF domain-containing phosphodiesterase [bacterium]
MWEYLDRFIKLSDIQNIKSKLTDATTGIPRISYYLDKVAKQLKDEGAIGLIYINCESLSKIEQEYSHDVYDIILKYIGQSIKEACGKVIRAQDIVAIGETEIENFIVFLSKKRTPGLLDVKDIEKVADRLIIYLSAKIFEITSMYLPKKPKIEIGWQIILYNPMVKPERQIIRAMNEVKEIAKYQSQKQMMDLKQRMKSIIHKMDIRIEYQPIVNSKTFEIVGYEALARGPEEFVNPKFMFEVAEETGLLYELDHLCRVLAVNNFKYQDKLLFINTYPSGIYDPTLKGNDFIDLLKRNDLTPKSVIFEISEKEAIKSYKIFKDAVNYYKQTGYRISVDDAGSGYSSLQSVIELEPDYLKADASIVKGVSNSIVKKQLINSLIEISNRIGATLIAEGVESEEDYQALKDINVQYIQGYWVAKPI